MLADELKESLTFDDAVALRLHVDAVVRTWRRPVQRYTEAQAPVRTGPEHERQIARVEAQSDAYHLTFGDTDVMVAYLLEITKTRKESPDT